MKKSFSRNTQKNSNLSRKLGSLDGIDFLKSLGRTTLLFGHKTTLHGINHIAGDFEDLTNGSHKTSKIMSVVSLFIWTATCVLGSIFAVVLIWLVWTKFQSTPTITTIETNNYPISNVQFPAVTICNINKVYAPNAKNITERLLAEGVSKENITNFLSLLSRLVYPEYTDPFYFKIDEIIIEKLNYTVDALMMELMQPCENMITSCAWLGTDVPCSSLFRVAKSATGFCCSFNSRAVRNSLEINSESDAVSDQLTRPIYHVSGYGENVGLRAFLHTEKYHYMAYSYSYYGIKILVNEPEDFPETSVSTVIVQPSYDVSVAVVPSVIVSQPEVRNIPLSKRNCMFDDEGILRTADEYGYQSCVTECVMDEALRRCNCVPFYYPPIFEPGSTTPARQCSVRDINCLRKYRHTFSSIQPDQAIIGFNNTVLEGMECNCYPSCSEQNYEVEAMHSLRFSNDMIKSNSKAIQNSSYSNFTTLKVFFKDMTCIKYRRGLYMTWDEVFASCGGIFGLCLGGSIISFIEMLYYFTFRMYKQILLIKREQINGIAKKDDINQPDDDLKKSISIIGDDDDLPLYPYLN